MNKTDEIISTIKRNRISTCEVSDSLGKTGVIQGVSALNNGHFRVGRVRFVYAYNKSNWELHEQLESVQEGEVVVVHAIGCDDYAVFGSLVSKFCILYRNVEALVVVGLVRDAHQLRKENYPIWCQGITPLGCHNKPNSIPPDARLLESISSRYTGSVAVCDDSGVVVVPEESLNDKLLSRLHKMELQEDAWFHSIDTDGYSTYETVCLRKYLDEGSVFRKYDELLEDDD
jgi:regulator of RNase E activity RraA